MDNPIVTDCPTGETFDYVLGECAIDGMCYDLCDPCGVYCINEGRIPNPLDCHSYYYCEPPVGLAEFTCEEGSYFEPTTAKCVVGDSCDNTCVSEITTADPGY